MRRDWHVAAPGLVGPGIGVILVAYCPALVIARGLDRFTGGTKPTWDQLVPYLAALAAVWLGGEFVWRVAIHFLNRACTRGTSRLYTIGMDALLEKDMAFFHDNFAGSLTKRLVGYATSYE